MNDDSEIHSVLEMNVQQSESFHNPERIQVDEATNGKEALDIFKTHFGYRCPNEACPHPIYKLIIMDLQMPIMDGFDSSTEILKIRASNPEVYSQIETNIVALTSYTDLSTKTRCLDIGLKEVLHKPLNSDELKRAVALYHFDIGSEKYEKYLLALKQQKEYLKQCERLQQLEMSCSQSLIDV